MKNFCFSWKSFCCENQPVSKIKRNHKGNMISADWKILIIKSMFWCSKKREAKWFKWQKPQLRKRGDMIEHIFRVVNSLQIFLGQTFEVRFMLQICSYFTFNTDEERKFAYKIFINILTQPIMTWNVVWAATDCFFLFIFAFIHSFICSFVLLSVFEWRKTCSSWVWLKAGNQRTRTSAHGKLSSMLYSTRMSKRGYSIGKHGIAFIQMGGILCVLVKVYIRWCQELLVKLHFFRVVFLCFRFVSFLAVSPSSFVSVEQRLVAPAWDDPFVVCCYFSYFEITSGGNCV